MLAVVFDSLFLASAIVAILSFVFVFVFVPKILKITLHTLFIMLVNSVMSLVCILLLNAVGISVPLTLPVLIPVILFGVPALGTILILMYFGVVIS